MTLRHLHLAGVVVLVLPALAACSGGNSARVRPLPPAPTGPVMAQPLPSQQPVTPPPVTAEPEQPPVEQPQVAALPSAQQAPTQESVLGQWSLRGPGDSCELYVTLTSWTGGHRASTRGCGSPELSSVGAWNIEGNLVVLKDNDGNPVARLAKTGATQYDGRLDLGGTLSMSR